MTGYCCAGLGHEKRGIRAAAVDFEERSAGETLALDRGNSIHLDGDGGVDLDRDDHAARVFWIEGELGDASHIDAVEADGRSPSEAGDAAGEDGSVVGEFLLVLRARQPQHRDDERQARHSITNEPTRT